MYYCTLKLPYSPSHCSYFKKNQPADHSPYENTVIPDRERENDYIMMKPARVSGSAIDMPLPSTPTSVTGHVPSPLTSSMMSSRMTSVPVTRATQLEEANV